MQLADKIRIIRKARGLSQEGLGYSLSRVSKNGVSRQAVSDWENGKSEPCLENIRDLAEVLGVSFDALLDESIDLDQPEVLNAILAKQKHITYEVEDKPIGSIGKSISYHIETNALNIKHFIITIVEGLFILLTIALFVAHIYAKANDAILGLAFVSLMPSGAFLIMSIAFEIIPAIRGKRTHWAGSIDYGDLDIEDKYIKMEGYENMDNHLYVDINKIVEMKVRYPKKRRQGDVEVVIDGKEHPMIILKVVKPQELVETFNKIKQVLEENKQKENGNE